MSWLIALSGLCSRVDNVLISVAILALTKMADISDPRSLWSAHRHSQPRQHATIKDLPCTWHHTHGGTSKTELMGRSFKMIEKPTCDAVTC